MPVRGIGGTSETPTSSPTRYSRSYSSKTQLIRREQGPGGECGGAMRHKSASAVTEPQDETSTRRKEG